MAADPSLFDQFEQWYANCRDNEALDHKTKALIGIAAANLATKEAAASAVGLTGIFGYASTVASGAGMGWLVDHYGWDWAFAAMLIAVAAGTVTFMVVWNAPRDGYEMAMEPRGFEVETAPQAS